jgi:hypothetical protein
VSTHTPQDAGLWAAFIVVLLLLGFIMGLMIDTTHKIPSCEEDEVIVAEGFCAPIEGADFRDGFWYVTP